MELGDKLDDSQIIDRLKRTVDESKVAMRNYEIRSQPWNTAQESYLNAITLLELRGVKYE